jgi:hypothetical protein
MRTDSHSEVLILRLRLFANALKTCNEYALVIEFTDM